MIDDALKEIFATGVALRDLTTVRVGGTARLLAVPRSEAELVLLLGSLRRLGIRHRVLGGGSNLLPPDGVVEEVVVHPAALDSLTVEGTRLRIGAGQTLSNVVARAAEAGLGGVQVLAGIPGQIGGAITMNAGGRFGEIAEVVERVRVVLPHGEVTELAAAELRFGYRHSELPRGAVVSGTVLALREVADRRALRQETGRILKEKNAAQPTTGWNFGCTFKNPAGLSAGKLLDEAGLKGLRAGDARISPKHANFIENLGNARATDFRWLIAEAERLAFERKGVRLEREVRVWEERALPSARDEAFEALVREIERTPGRRPAVAAAPAW